MQHNAEALAAIDSTLDDIDAAIAAAPRGAFNSVAARAAVKLCKTAPADARRDAKRAIDAAARRPGDGVALAAARSAVGVVAFHTDAAARDADDNAMLAADYEYATDAAALAAGAPTRTDW